MHRLLAYVQQIPSGQQEEEFEEPPTSSITHFYLIKKQQKPWTLPNTDYSTPRLTQTYVLCYRTLVEQSHSQNLAVIRSLFFIFSDTSHPVFSMRPFFFRPSSAEQTTLDGWKKKSQMMGEDKKKYGLSLKRLSGWEGKKCTSNKSFEIYEREKHFVYDKDLRKKCICNFYYSR